MASKKVNVVGAGIAGMCAAIHLAKHGLQVKVFEKNDLPGGRCDRLSHQGHQFDTGPTLMVMPLLYEAELAQLGASIPEWMDLIRVDPTYTLVFDDGSQLALSSDLSRMYQQLEAIEPGSFKGFLRYLEEGQRHYDLGIEKLVYPDFRKAIQFFRPGNLPLIYQVKPFVKHYANMANYFKTPRLKAAFTFQDVYMGLSPFVAPATFSLLPYTEMAHGVWYPRGGMYQVAEALFALARQAGVEFVFDASVERIEVKGSRAQGVVAKGQSIESDVVLANADLPYVYRNLLPMDGQVEKLERKSYSCSVISFFWGVDTPYEALGPHTLFLADDYRANFTSIIHDLDLPANPSLYLHAPARLDPCMSPPGQDTLIAIVPVGHLNEAGGAGRAGEQDWEARRDRARQEVFRRLRSLGIHDLEEHIKFEINFTPLSWRKRYNLVKGSTHGLCHNLTQLAIMRPDFQHARYPNLYFAGASTRPGTGLPNALISGRHAAQRILDGLS
jgi:phytoene desaturase